MKYFFTCILSLLSFLSFAAPKADLWSYWNVSNANSTQVIDHSDWQKILDQNLVVKGENHLFNYAKISQQDKKSLGEYIKKLSQTDPKALNKKEQFAYWVNLYNALTVKVILDNYPTPSITKLGGVFSFGPWDKKLIKIDGKNLTLNDIEHRILRPIWRDKRIHYVVNCASLGCPNLATKAFTAANSEKQLKQSEDQFVHSRKGVQINGDKVQLSSIYDWYSVDFGGKKGVLRYLNQFYPELQRIKKKPSFDYSWGLNEVKP